MKTSDGQLFKRSCTGTCETYVCRAASCKGMRGAYHLLWQPLTFDISDVDDSQGVTHLEQKMFDAPP